jgi:antitoxin component YwqK of YwqJK toxin-antitoxin module
MRKLIFLIINFLFVLIVFSQKIPAEKCYYPIFIEEFGYLNDFELNKETKIQLQNTFIIKVYDCLGELDISIFSKDSVLLENGHYCNASDTAIGNFTMYDENMNEIEIEKKFIKPQKDGIWYWYDKSGIILQKKYYKKGKELN